MTDYGRTCRLVASVVVICTCGVRDGDAAETRTRRFIYNSDGTNVFLKNKPPMRPADVHKYVDEVVGTGVTTFFVCPNAGQNMYYSSEVADMLGTHVTPEQAERIREVAPAKRQSLERAAANLDALVDAGHDPMGLVVDRAREKGLEVFITFRLNEVHAVDKPESLLLSRFWRAHPEWRVGGPGWNGQALNFAVPEVRARRLAELRECCQRFDIDGLDLDFQRFPSYFPPGKGPTHLDTMTAWVREVRAMTGEVGRKRGRPLLLSARVMARPEQTRAAGLDPARWAKDGLVDFVTVAHFLHNDFPLPVAEYRNLLPDGTPLYGCIEVEPKADGYRRIARRLWKDGVDGVMLFNFFTSREEPDPSEPPFEVLQELGNPNPTVLPTLGLWQRGKETLVSAAFPNVPGFVCDAWCYESAMDFVGSRGLAGGKLELRHRLRDSQHVLIVTTVTPEPGAVEFAARAEVDESVAGALPASLPTPNLCWQLRRAPSFASAPDPYPEFVKRCFMFTEKGRTFLHETTRRKIPVRLADHQYNNPPWVQMYVGTWQQVPKAAPKSWADYSPDRYTTTVMGAVSRDGKHLAAIANDSATLMAQAWHDCMHNNAQWQPARASPAERVWRVRIYCLDNDPDALLQRVGRDFPAVRNRRE